MIVQEHPNGPNKGRLAGSDRSKKGSQGSYLVLIHIIDEFQTL